MAVGGAALSLARKAIIGLIAESAEAAGVGAKEIIPQVARQDLEPGGIHPDLMGSDLWKPSLAAPLLAGNTGWHLSLLLAISNTH